MKVRGADGLKVKAQNMIDAINHVKAYCKASGSPCVANIDDWPDTRSDELIKAIISAIDAGVVVVVFAGDNNVDACLPGIDQSINEAINVGRVGKNDEILSNSNYGDCVDVFAPGEDVIGPGIENPTKTVQVDYAYTGSKFQLDYGCVMLSASHFLGTSHACLVHYDTVLSFKLFLGLSQLFALHTPNGPLLKSRTQSRNHPQGCHQVFVLQLLMMLIARSLGDLIGSTNARSLWMVSPASKMQLMSRCSLLVQASTVIMKNSLALLVRMIATNHSSQVKLH